MNDEKILLVVLKELDELGFGFLGEKLIKKVLDQPNIPELKASNKELRTENEKLIAQNTGLMQTEKWHTHGKVTLLQLNTEQACEIASLRSQIAEHNVVVAGTRNWFYKIDLPESK
jgi:hypothetical protein